MKILANSTAEADSLPIWWFLRGLGLIYASAFLSMGTQICGLIGEDGIIPAQAYLQRIAQILPDDHLWKFPTLFWLDASNAALKGVCSAGVVASAFVILSIQTRTALLACYLLYLSIATAGQDFTGFQWDALLLESGFMASVLPWHSKTTLWLFRLLIARFMFMSGVVKIASGDPAWRDLSALGYHYLTQPLPSPLAYYVYYLPAWWHQLCVVSVLLIELPIPFLVFFPRPFRLFAAWSFIALQTGIILTGSYTFFNLLTLLLCLFLFDNRDLAKITPGVLTRRITRQRCPTPSKGAESWARPWAAFVTVILASHVWLAQTHRPPFAPLQTLLQITVAFNAINNYGPFAVMTKARDEVIVEGSNDGVTWLEYGFRYKPGAVDHQLRWNIPHQPRLDWQLWFVPLSPYMPGEWFEQFHRKLLSGSPSVLALLGNNPFPVQPPRFLKSTLYRYTFTPAEERKLNGQIWKREKRNILLMLSR